MTAFPHTDVLVVGAGPVGMTAAAMLAALDIRVTVIEKNPGTADDPKAISLDDESLRAYQRAGIVSDVLTVIAPGTGTRYYASDNRAVFHARAAVPYRSGYPFKNPFAQPDLERVLRSALERNPLVELRFSTELTGLDQFDDHIAAQTTGASGPAEITAAFLLGADGGRSRVRSLLDIRMTGRSLDDLWLVVDTLGDPHTERYGMHHGDPLRPHVIVPGLGSRCRYEFYLYPGEGDPGGAPPFELIQRLLAPHRSITPDQVERAVNYRFHALTADRWRAGRAMLAGDAAHMMPPFAGQGLNTGIRDVTNLAWKLAAVIHGSADESLLATYESERKPHAEAVVRISERLGRVVMTTNARIARFRDRVIRQALESSTGRSYFEEMRYRPSPRITTGVVMGTESIPLVGTTVGQPLVFDLESHHSVLLDELLGSGWAVLGVGLKGDATSDWEQALEVLSALDPHFIDVPLDDMVFDRPAGIRIAIDLDTRLYSEFEGARGAFVILRPDRVVAAVVRPDQLASVVPTLGFFLHARPLSAARNT